MESAKPPIFTLSCAARTRHALLLAANSCTRGNEPMHAVRWLASPRQGECFLRGRKALLNDFWYFSSSKSTIKEKFLYDSSRANDVRPYSIESKLCQHPKQKIRLLIRFFFCIYRRKRKSYEKENAEIEISRSAEHDKGSAPLNAPPFEKGGRKLYDDEIFYFLP